MIRIVMILTILSTVSFSAEDHMPVVSDGKIEAFADYSVFKGDSSASYVEVYVQALINGLSFRELDDGSIQVELGVDASLSREDGSSIGSRSWTTPGTLPSRDMAEQEGLSFFELFDTALAPGQYNLELILSDVIGDEQNMLEVPLDVSSYDKSCLDVSNIQLARSIQRATESGKWVKNGYQIMPHPSRRYGRSLPEISFYTEVYGLSVEDSGSAGRYTVLYSVKNEAGISAATKGPFLMPKAGPTSVLVGKVNVADLDPGHYELTVSVSDTIAFSMEGCRTIAESSTWFIQGDQLPTLPEIRGLTAAESAAAEIELRYIASQSEISKFRELTAVGRARFLDQLWASKDPDPETPENEARTELHRRAAYAQSAYAEINRPGMETDRGRTYIKYGGPNDVSIETGERTCKDHEIWHYYLEREYIFVFLDEFSTGEFRLIHSNHPNEMEHADWIDRVCESIHSGGF